MDKNLVLIRGSCPLTRISHRISWRGGADGRGYAASLTARDQGAGPGIKRDRAHVACAASSRREEEVDARAHRRRRATQRLPAIPMRPQGSGGAAPCIWLHGARNAVPFNPRTGSLGPAGILDSMSRSPRKRNTVDTPGSTAAAEGRVESKCGAVV